MRTKATEYRDQFIEELRNSLYVKNLQIEDYQNHTFLIFEKKISKLSSNNQYRPVLIIFNNKKKKPISNYYYNTEERRQMIYLEMKKNILKEIALKKEKEKENKRIMDQVQIGTILYSSWGYEQTNIDFFIVVSRKGQTLILQEIGNIIVKESANYSGQCIADPTKLIGDPFEKRITKFGVKLNSYSHACVWSGKPLYWSNYY